MTGRPTLGDFVPDFVLPVVGGTRVRFYGRAGGQMGILWFIAPGSESTAETIGLLGALDAVLYGVNRGSPEQTSALADAHGVDFTVFADEDGTLGEWAGASAAGAVVVFGADLRVVAAWSADDAEWPAEAGALLDQQPVIEAVEVGVQAPVLLLDNLLSREVCDRLVGLWDEGGHVATGVEQSGAARRETAIVDEMKRRSDHTVEDPALIRELTQRIGRRLIPAVRKAFRYDGAGFEGFKIGCYEGDSGGFFRAHRDNLSPSTAHRDFAVSINLNDGYAGGHLRFVEYGPHLYRPKKGGAVIFSSSLLHEALDITEGRRFVLLSFLFRPRKR